MKSIKLTQGKVSQVSDCDYPAVSQFQWFAVKDRSGWYAKRKVNGQLQPMQNYILGIPIGEPIDHWDRDGLNNQRGNLRPCTHAQNCFNRFYGATNKSGFKGVSWKRPNKKWCAQIKALGKVLHLGLFADPKEAAKAYDEAAELHFGQFALTNKRLGLL